MDSGQDIRTKTGGAYIPPAKLRLMQQSITDKNSEQYQRLSWEALKKSINGLINKVNISNIETMVRELFQINLIRGRGLFCRAIMRAQASSPTFTHVYAALVAVCNSKVGLIHLFNCLNMILIFLFFVFSTLVSHCWQPISETIDCTISSKLFTK